ncbi:MAG: hypothetical protein IH991_23250, partial [Planctomycetes bacterium]|nr:hypothetical protein [Planctomycetota bacterium]
MIDTPKQSHAKQSVSRRGFLRGAGVALALPWLESLPIRAEDSGKRATATGKDKPP